MELCIRGILADFNSRFHKNDGEIRGGKRQAPAAEQQQSESVEPRAYNLAVIEGIGPNLSPRTTLLFAAVAIRNENQTLGVRSTERSNGKPLKEKHFLKLLERKNIVNKLFAVLCLSESCLQIPSIISKEEALRRFRFLPPLSVVSPPSSLLLLLACLQADAHTRSRQAAPEDSDILPFEMFKSIMKKIFVESEKMKKHVVDSHGTAAPEEDKGGNTGASNEGLYGQGAPPREIWRSYHHLDNHLSLQPPDNSNKFHSLTQENKDFEYRHRLISLARQLAQRQQGSKEISEEYNYSLLDRVISPCSSPSVNADPFVERAE
eukprot:274653-Hanusia_phi.AAC.3